MIVAVYGANMACDEAQVTAVDDALDGADVLLLQLETPLDVALSAAALAKEWGVTVVWDPAPALEMGHEAYRLCDVLTPNQAEAEFLTGIAVTGPASAEAAARSLVEQGVSAAVPTLGSGGAFYMTRDESGLVPPFSVDAIDSVAAGDAFAAGLGIATRRGTTTSTGRQVRVGRRSARRHEERRTGGDAIQGRGGCAAGALLKPCMSPDPQLADG